MRIVVLIFWLLIVSTAYALELPAFRMTKPEISAVITALRAKYAPVYRENAGFKSNQIVWAKITALNENQVKSTSRTEIKQRDFFYRKPERTVQTYVENDQKKDPGDYPARDGEPALPLFDEEGERRYALTIEGYRQWKNQLCYQVRITPVKPDSRTPKGELWVTASGLEIVYARFQASAKPFPLRDFESQVWFSDTPGYPIPDRVSATLNIDVPIFYPNTAISFSTEYSRQEWLKK